MSADDLLREEQDRTFVLGLPTAEVVTTVNPRDGHLIVENSTGTYMITPNLKVIPLYAGNVPEILEALVDGITFLKLEKTKMAIGVSPLTIYGFNAHPTLNQLLAGQDGPVDIVRIDGAYHFMKLIEGDKPKYKRIAMYNSNGKA